MKFTLQWTEQAEAQLGKMEHHIAKRIHAKMEWFAAQEDPISFAKRLVHPAATLFRFRIGDYRAICSLQSGKIQIIFVLEIKDRKDAY